MECTQRLECTQDLYDSPIEKTCPEQIGFLGICGSKYPVKKGPNKIGRDPQTCSIVLQLESISRQHAVINILNKTEFMLMDLDSANKTKLSGKTLQPYIPHPLQHGDTVQFGKVFGIFRLLHEDAELPATQALDVPDTPVAGRPGSQALDVPDTPVTGRPCSRLLAVTTIPESPEVSDRDDSFIAPSQPKFHKEFKNESNHFIKPAGKTISIQPIGSKKIDNVYWNSSRKSTSIGSTLDESNQSINDSTISVNKSNNINLHEMETQPPTGDVHMHNVSVDSIYTANTQMPNMCNHNTETNRQNVDAIYTADTQMPNRNVSADAIHTVNTQLPSVSSRNVSVDSIYTANTQAPDNFNTSPSIHSLDTQMPATDKLPNICKVNNQQEMQFDFCLANKENDISIFNAETQHLLQNIPIKSEPINKVNKQQNETSKSSFHTSEEEILFDDIDNESFQDEFESQSLLPESPKKRKVNNLTKNKTDPVITVQCGQKPAKRDARLKSDSSTDCDDIEIAATQQLPARPAEDDLTDCEDDPNHDTKTDQQPKQNNQNTVFEEMLTQVLDDELPSCNNSTITIPKTNTNLLDATSSKIPIEDMLTQVIEENQPTLLLPTNDINFDDMPTQIISDDKGLPYKNNFDELQTQILFDDIPDKVNEIKKISNDFVSPFKVPMQSPRKAKRKDTSKVNKVIETNTDENNPEFKNIASENDDKYYEATQDILDDLCTQKLSPEVLPVRHDDDEVVPCSVEDNITGDYKLPGLDYDVLPLSDKSSESNLDEKLNKFVTHLSREQIQDVIGVYPLKRQPSDPSDTEATPKKVHPVKFFETDLPDSQEIKTSVSLHYKSNVTESSSESETENDTEEQFTPILYRKKKKPKVDARLDVTKKLDVDSLPSRVITRVRKPPLKHDKDNLNKHKPQYLTEQEGDISNEIVIENITRLKSKNEKNKSSIEVNKKLKNETKAGALPLSKIEDNSKDKLQSDSMKDHASKTKHNTKDNTHSDNIQKHPSKSNITNDKVKTDDIKDVSASDHVKRDKRGPDDDKEQTNKSERSKSKKPNVKEDNSTISKLSKSKTHSGVLNIDVTSERSKRSTRSTRNQNKVTEKDADKRSASLEKENNKNEMKDDKRKKHSKKQEEKQEPDVQEVRRSRRQRSYKEKKENDSLIKVKITKPAKKEVKKIQVQHENSTVYSVSSDSGTDTPRLKRSATEVLQAPSAKRTRSATQSRVQSEAQSRAQSVAQSAAQSAGGAACADSALQPAPAKRLDTLRVLFTAFPFEEVRNKLESLGAEVVADVARCAVLVTLRVRRTFKLLCAVGLGRPVVGAAWVQACADSGELVDPWQYLLQDAAAEQRFQFSLARTLRGRRGFLRGYSVSATPGVKPAADEMKQIVECSGGAWREGGPRWLCVSCGADRALWPALAARGAAVVSSELVLGGVLRQRLDIAGSRLA